MNALRSDRTEVCPPLSTADKADAAEFHYLAFALLREQARYDVKLADRAQALGLDVGSWPPTTGLAASPD